MNPEDNSKPNETPNAVPVNSNPVEPSSATAPASGPSNTVMDVQPPVPRTVNPGSDIQINSEDGTISQNPSDVISPMSDSATENNESQNQENADMGAISPSTPVEGIADNSDMQQAEAPEPQTQEVQNPDQESQTAEVPQPNQSPDKSEEQNPMAIPVKPAKKSRLPKVVIFVAVLVAISLCAVAVYAFLQRSNEPKTSETTQQSQSTDQSKEQIDGDEVDKAISDLEQDINSTNDQNDIPSSESMNDATLGL